LASGSVMSLRGFPGHRRGPQGRSPSRLRVVMLLAAGLALGLWAMPTRGAMTEPESGGAAAAQAKNEQPEPQIPHEAGENKADAEQPSPAAPPPSAPTTAVQSSAAATGRTPADETPALTAANLLRPFGYAFFANAPETFAPIPDTAAPRDYLLAPGDKLRITFWSVIGQETTLEPTVDPRGQVHVPLLGLVTANGVTIEDFERKLLAGLGRNFAHVEGQVTLASLRSLRVLVAGEATRPGAYTVSSLSTAFNVLYLAGGPNERGSMRSIRLLRGNREVGVIDLYEFLLTGKRTRDYRLVAGDTLFIPVVGKTVGIRGEVRRRAPYEVGVTSESGDGPEDVGQAVYPEPAEGPSPRRLLGPMPGAKRAVYPEPAEGPSPVIPGAAVAAPPQPGAVPHERAHRLAPLKTVTAYEMLPNESLADLIHMAGGIEPTTDIRRLQIERIQDNERRIVLDLDLGRVLAPQPGDNPVELRDGDLVTIYRVLDQRMNTIELTGQVARPGVYELKPGMRVSDLVEAAQGLRGETYMERAEIRRTNADSTVTLIPFNLEQALYGGDSPLLQRWDRVIIYSPEHVRDPRVVSVVGQVRHPGTYERTEGMTISDLLFQAGGTLPEAAEWAEVARTRGADGTTIMIADLRRLSAGGSSDNLELRDGDRVLVPEVGQYQRAPRTVRIAGEVRFPGAYALEGRGETLGHLLRRAGGVTDDAFVTGAVFIRRIGNMVTDYQEQIARQVQAKAEARAQLQYQLELAKAARGAAPLLPSPGPSAPVTPAPSAASAVAVAASSDQATGAVAVAAPEKFSELISSGRVPIDLAAVIADPDHDDVPLEEGDLLIVPRRPTTVLVTGAAVSPGAVLFAPGQPIDYYVQRTGGYDDDANAGRVVVLRADGAVLRRDLVKQVEVGDIIVIPSRPVILREKDTWGEVGKALSAAASAAMTFYLIREVR